MLSACAAAVQVLVVERLVRAADPAKVGEGTSALRFGSRTMQTAVTEGMMLAAEEVVGFAASAEDKTVVIGPEELW